MVVYKIHTDPIPIVHRITTVQEVKDAKNPGKTKRIFLSKGDNNRVDDRGLYPKNSVYLDETNI